MLSDKEKLDLASLVLDNIKYDKQQWRATVHQTRDHDINMIVESRHVLRKTDLLKITHREVPDDAFRNVISIVDEMERMLHEMIVELENLTDPKEAILR